MGSMTPNAAVNLPVQMMSLADRSGRLTPVGFRYEDEEHRICAVKINRVICREKLSLAGIKEIKVICSALFGERERLIELRYSVDSQKWRVCQFLS